MLEPGRRRIAGDTAAGKGDINGTRNDNGYRQRNGVRGANVHRARVDITNAPLVAAYKRAQRSRFAVSKLMSKSAVSAETVPDQANTVEKMVDDFWRVHMMIVAARNRSEIESRKPTRSSRMS